MACFTSNQCYEVMESYTIDIMPRREAIRTLLNLQDPTNSTKLGAYLPTPPPTDYSDSCSGNCGCNCVGPPGCVGTHQ
ncbi:unnamed protein product [Rotaria sordida]|uniref:Uncharacterized protein n=1 Tax=Rotaria sordida TaxID=392033 RepID=A0A820BY30_9BILA|nr:unnamed protein product [Rotaria sordida]